MKQHIPKVKPNTQTNTQTDNKRAIFTYTGRKTRAVTKIFQKAGIKVAFTTKHTINNLLRHKHDHNDKYDSSGIYQLECTDCGKQYIGQTG
jgi:hypothetical protein